MGSRKLLIFLLFLIFETTCYANEEIFISSCRLTEDSLVVEMILKDVIIYKITEVQIDYKNIPISILFEPGDIVFDKINSKITINLNLKNKILYTNEEAELYIKISGGFSVGDIFIGNQISKIEPFYSFPSKAYESVRIIILKQHYVYRM